MIAYKSTTNLTFFYFFFTSRSSWAASGKRTIARAVFRTEAAAGSGCLGFQLRNRTIVPRIPSSRGPEPPWHTLLSGTGRTIARNPDSCDTCWAPTARTIIRFLGRTAAGQPPDTEQSFGLAAKPGWASTRKANNGWFLRVWW
jgi:hypothetical protein